MVRITGLLPPVEGATLATMLGAISEANYRREHPVRARVLGGHDTDTRDQRLADALLELAGIAPSAARRRDVRQPDDTPFGGTQPDDGEPGGSSQAPPASPSHNRPPIRVTTSKPATVIVFNVERFQAEMLNRGPMPVTSSLFDQVRRDLFFCFENNAGEVLKYVRGRRDPTLLQKIAVWARDMRCQYPGCDAAASASQIHHINEWLADLGFTDVEVLILLCHAHHQHLHVNQLIAVRESDGTVAIRLRSTNQLIATATPMRVAA